MKKQNDGRTLIGCDRCRRGFPTKQMVEIIWLPGGDVNYSNICSDCAEEIKQWIAAGVKSGA